MHFPGFTARGRFVRGSTPLRGCLFIHHTEDILPAPKSLALLTRGQLLCGLDFYSRLPGGSHVITAAPPAWLRLPGEAELEEGPCPR